MEADLVRGILSGGVYSNDQKEYVALGREERGLVSLTVSL